MASGLGGQLVEHIALIGVGATLVLDCWGFVRKPLLGIARPDYGLVGRWVGHMTRGRFRHDAIAASSSYPRERFLGWIVHYVTGIAFAFLLVGIFGASWLQHPTLGPALAIGVGTAALPFLVMQPGMGAGIAASKTPRPVSARLQTLVTHTVFGLGLYVAGWAMLMIA